MKRILIFAVACELLKLVLALLPEAFVLAAFCRGPAEAAAFYYGAPLDAETLAFTARGVSLAVTRACAATDFFALVAATLVAARILGRRRAWFLPVDLLLAWIVTVVVNSLRVIALVPIDALFPKDRVPIVHLATGVAFFLPALVIVWYYSSKEIRK